MPTVHNWEEWDEVEEKTNEKLIREKITKNRKKKENKKNEESFKTQNNIKSIS
jgi:hypothetical protein|tara:strand:- start:750 stop:908 length:159 start_codon:yes stop_codon:yes gene_type:complete